MNAESRYFAAGIMRKPPPGSSPGPRARRPTPICGTVESGSNGCGGPSMRRGPSKRRACRAADNVRRPHGLEMRCRRPGRSRGSRGKGAMRHSRCRQADQPARGSVRGYAIRHGEEAVFEPPSVPKPRKRHSRPRPAQRASRPDDDFVHEGSGRKTWVKRIGWAWPVRSKSIRQVSPAWATRGIGRCRPGTDGRRADPDLEVARMVHPDPRQRGRRQLDVGDVLLMALAPVLCCATLESWAEAHFQRESLRIHVQPLHVAGSQPLASGTAANASSASGAHSPTRQRALPRDHGRGTRCRQRRLQPPKRVRSPARQKAPSRRFGPGCPTERRQSCAARP